MKKLTILILILIALGIQSAYADSSSVYTGHVHPDLPVLTLTVKDTGKRTEEPVGENILQVVIEAPDGSLSQSLTWESIESPAFERIASLARLMDLNFDGYNDLVLLTAQGAQNVYYAFSLWDVEQHHFRPVRKDWQFKGHFCQDRLFQCHWH